MDNVSTQYNIETIKDSLGSGGVVNEKLNIYGMKRLKIAGILSSKLP